MHDTVFTIYTINPDTGASIYQCETTDEELAEAEVDRLNSNMARAGLPCTAYYTP